MNEDEETMIMGQTIRDLAKAKQKLQSLISQRDSWIKVLKKAIDILNNDGRILDPGDQVDFPTAVEIAAIVSDIGDVRSKIVGLESRMKEFGL